ncbi:MAG TPA: hypothetical protein VHZ33_15890 [Trebonia sp.]|nr:hypothetical protein [Trebonia sp.]
MAQMSGPRPVTVRQRPRWTVVSGTGVVIMLLGLAVSLGAQPTMSGKVTAAVFFAAFIAIIVWLWRRANRWRDKLEISSEAIEFRHGRRGGPSITLTRADGTDLRLIPRLSDHGVTAGPRLAVVGSGTAITVYGFSANAVRRGCTAAGWRFGNGTPAQAAQDLRVLRDEGRLAEAAQLIDLFGPCDWPAEGDQDTSVSAMILERYADDLAGRDRAAARAAYLRAAGAQRSFAAFASAGGEGIARMAEADRLTARAAELP